MSELIQKADSRVLVRWTLLTGASAFALTACAASAIAQDNSGPNVWIELGGQLNRLNDGSEPFLPAFTSMRTSLPSSQKFEKPSLYGLEEYGKISFQPGNSPWVFSVAIRYGRTSTDRHVRQQSPFSAPYHYDVYPSSPGFVAYTRAPIAARFADTTARNSEQHAIADFQAGKDVGLGLFGSHSSSVVSMGVRFAQFTERSNISLKSDPDWRFQLKPFDYGPYHLSGLAQPYHSNMAGLVADHSFEGVGPSVSWNGATPIAGNEQKAEFDFDWGVNAAVLFGRQKAQTQHHETVSYNDGGHGQIINAFFYGYRYPLLASVYRHTHATARSRSVIVPNVGGFAALSFRYAAAKVSFGYKADFFFGAMDGGIDTAKTYSRNFYGPYATISIGLGG